MEQLRHHNDNRRFKKFLRVSPEMFDYIVNRVGPTIERKKTRRRRAIPVEQRVAIALRYVATGESYTSLEFRFRVSNQLISSIVPEVMSATYEVFKDEFMKCLSTPEEWKEFAKGFKEK